MEKNSSIIEHRGKIYTLLDLKNTPIKKTKNELSIIVARGKGKLLFEMNDDNLRYATDQIMCVGSALYGCDLPQTELLASVLSKNIIDYLLEFGYETFTLAEVILAMQMNMEPELKNPAGENLLTVKFTGLFIHVSFLAAVLRNYMVLRNNLDRKFQNHIDGY